MIVSIDNHIDDSNILIWEYINMQTELFNNNKGPLGVHKLCYQFLQLFIKNIFKFE